MADLAAARAADRPHFADGERREVVVEHELLAVLVDQAVDALLVAAGAERDRDQRLRLAALEHGRAVHPRQDVDLALDLPQRLVVAAVGPRAVEDQIADDASLPGRARRCESASASIAPSAVGIGNQLGDGLRLELLTPLRPGPACRSVCLAALSSS